MITPKEVERFVASLPVEKFFGVGKVTAEKMHRHGIFTGADLRNASEPDLVRWFGKAGHDYHLYGEGIDNRPVITFRKRRSIGSEITFTEDIGELERLIHELRDVGSETWARARRHDFRGRTVVLKLKYDDFHQITRSATLQQGIDSEESLIEAGERLLQVCPLDNKKVRLIGLTITNSIDEENDPQLRLPFPEW